MTSIDLRQALRDYPASLVGWWTSADGSGQLDMTGATVEQAVAEMAAQCADDDQLADLMAGNIEVAI
jgi:hypothetical protein